MKTNLSKTAVVVFIIALVAGALLARQVARERRNQTVRVTRPMAGFNQFISELSWIRLTQLRGRGTPLDQKQSAVLRDRFAAITDLDPLFATAYEQGAMDIAHTAPEDALKLIDKALAVGQLKGWRLPFTAGFIASWQLHDPNRAIGYLERATQQPDCPSHVRRMLIYCKAKTVGEDPLKTLDLWTDYYWSGQPTMDSAGLGIPPGRQPPLRGTYQMRTGSDDTGMVLNRISQQAQAIIDQAQNDLKTADAARQTELHTRIDHITKVVHEIYAQQHICSKCFRPYQPGDRFCVYDGTPVEPYGLCRNGHIMRGGAFCQICGAPAAK